MNTSAEEMLLDTIARIGAKVPGARGRRPNEQNTKSALIDPMLEALGWDTRDDSVVDREFKPESRDNPVDYALKVNHVPRLLVEAKALGEDLSDRKWIGQLLHCATVAGVEWCVLTDGDEYRFYNASVPVDAELKLLITVRVSDPEPGATAQVLQLIARSNLDENRIAAAWKDHYVHRQVKGALLDMIKTAGKDMVKLVRRRVSGLGPKEVAESLRGLQVQITAPSPFAIAAPGAKGKGAGRAGTRKGGSTGLAELVTAGYLHAPLTLKTKYRGQDLEAVLLADGGVEFRGRRYPTCSGAGSAAKAAAGSRATSTDGWSFWLFDDGTGKRRTLREARERFLKGQGGGRAP